MKKIILTLFNKVTLALFLILCTATAGCAGLLPGIILAAQDAQMILQNIQNFSDNYFLLHPNTAEQNKINNAITAAGTALDGAIRTVSGIDNITQAQADAAFANFEAAYNDLLTVVKDIGVLSADVQATTKTTSGGLNVPTPLIMLNKAKAQAKKN